MFSWHATRTESSISRQSSCLSVLYKPERLTVSKALVTLVRSMKPTCNGRDCSTLFSWSCLSENIRRAKAAPTLEDNSVSALTNSGQEKTSKKVRGNAQKRDDTIVVVILTIALVLVESNDVSVSDIFQKAGFIPPAVREYAEERRYQRLQVSLLPWLKSCPLLEQIAAASWIIPKGRRMCYLCIVRARDRVSGGHIPQFLYKGGHNIFCPLNILW